MLQEERVYWYGHVIEACSSGLLRHGLNFSIAWCTMRLISVEKRLEAYINAEGDHSEHLLWHCLPDIPVATHYHRFFSQPQTTIHYWLFPEPPTLERIQQTFSQMKTFCNSQVGVVTFLGGVGTWIIIFSWNNANNHKYVWIIPLKMTSLDFPRKSSYIWQVRWINL